MSQNYSNSPLSSHSEPHHNLSLPGHSSDLSYEKYFVLALEKELSDFVTDIAVQSDGFERVIERYVKALQNAGMIFEAKQLEDRIQQQRDIANGLAIASLSTSGVSIAAGITRQMLATSEQRLLGTIENVGKPLVTAISAGAATLANIGLINPIMAPIGVGIAAIAKVVNTVISYREEGLKLAELENGHAKDLAAITELQTKNNTQIETLKAAIAAAIAENTEASIASIPAKKMRLIHETDEQQNILFTIQAIKVSLEHHCAESTNKRMELIGDFTTELFVAISSLSAGLLFFYVTTAGVAPEVIVAMAAALTGPVGVAIFGALASDYLLSNAFKINDALNTIYELMQRKWEHGGVFGKTAAGIAIFLITYVQVVTSPVILFSYFYARPIACFKQLITTLPNAEQFADASLFGKILLGIEYASKAALILSAAALTFTLTLFKASISLVKTAVNLVGAAVASISIWFAAGEEEQKKKNIAQAFTHALHTLANNIFGAAVMALFTKTPLAAVESGLFSRFRARFNALYAANNGNDTDLLSVEAKDKNLSAVLFDGLVGIKPGVLATMDDSQLMHTEAPRNAICRNAKACWEKTLTAYIESKEKKLQDAGDDAVGLSKLRLATEIKAIMTSDKSLAEKLQNLQDIEFNRPVTGIDAEGEDTRKVLQRSWINKSELFATFNQCKDYLLLESGTDGVQALIANKLKSLDADSATDKDFLDSQKINALRFAQQSLERAAGTTSADLRNDIIKLDELITRPELAFSRHQLSETRQILHYARTQLVMCFKNGIEADARAHAEGHDLGVSITSPLTMQYRRQQQKSADNKAKASDTPAPALAPDSDAVPSASNDTSDSASQPSSPKDGVRR